MGQSELEKLMQRVRELHNNPKLREEVERKLGRRDARNKEAFTQLSGPYYESYEEERKEMIREFWSSK